MTRKKHKATRDVGLMPPSKLPKMEAYRLGRTFRVIQCVSKTLEGGFDVEDPCYIFLTSMISPYGFGMSRVYCFIYDPQARTLR